MIPHAEKRKWFMEGERRETAYEQPVERVFGEEVGGGQREADVRRSV
jgi:hypothetical protein